MVSLISICTEKSWKIRFFREFLTPLRFLRIPRVKLNVKFVNKKIPLVLPLKYIEHALLNLEHVLIDCDYFQVENAIPSLGSSVLDIGGFLGFYTVASSLLAGKNGIVHVFEPNPLVLPYLARNTEIASSIGARVYVYPRALCAERGQTNLYIGENPAVSSTRREHVEAFTTITCSLPVMCVKLSSVLRYFGYIDVVKIDVEGLEVELLREAGCELRRVKNLVIEVHRDLVETSEVEKILLNHGFTHTLIYTPSEIPHQVVLYAWK